MIELIVQSGIEKGVIVTLLLLPFIVSLIAFTRHILGMRSLGIYLSLVITLIFFKLGNTGLEDTYYSNLLQGFKYGIPLLFIVFSSTLIFYALIKKLALHYYPKLALVITGVTTSLILVLTILGLLNYKDLLIIDPFTLILIVAITEKYFSILARKSYKATIIISIESIVLAGLCFLIISFEPFIDFLIKYPYLILLLFPINFFVGKFTGLRVSEYFRFMDILTDKN